MGKLLALFTGNPITMLYVAGAIALAAGLAGASGAWTVQGYRLDAVKAEFKGFKDVAKAQGEAAAKEAARVNLVNSKALEVANAKITKLSTDNAVLIKRLRNANPPQSRLPAPDPASKRPDLLCLDRESYQRENGILIANLFAGARSLADEGTTNTMRLSTAAEWAASLAR